MIRMMRMHLINWHNFIDDIIDFKNVNLLDWIKCCLEKRLLWMQFDIV